MFLSFYLQVSAQEIEKVMNDYSKSIISDYKRNSDLKEQLESFQINYYRPNFTKPVVSISRIKNHEIKNVKYVYSEIYHLSIVIKSSELLKDNYWDDCFSGESNKPNKVETQVLSN